MDENMNKHKIIKRKKRRNKMKISCEFTVGDNYFATFEKANSQELCNLKFNMSKCARRYFNCKNEFNISNVYKRYYEIKHIKSTDYIGVDLNKSKRQKREYYWKVRDELKCKIEKYKWELNARKIEYISSCKKCTEGKKVYDERKLLYQQLLDIKKRIEEL